MDTNLPVMALDPEHGPAGSPDPPGLPEQVTTPEPAPEAAVVRVTFPTRAEYKAAVKEGRKIAAAEALKAAVCKVCGTPMAGRGICSKCLTPMREKVRKTLKPRHERRRAGGGSRSRQGR